MTSERPALRTVAMPTEHGGWGLTIEPGLLGIAVAPHPAGVALALAALVAFVARTPLKVVLVDAWRGRRLPRTQLAKRVAGVEVAALALLVVVAALTAATRMWWLPLVLAAPLLVLELSFDMRSRSRRLVPELAGSVAIASVAAAIALAGDEPSGLAYGLWAILAARAVTSIPHVRGQILRLHQRTQHPATTVVADGAALAIAALAVVADPSLVAGAVAVAAVVVAQRAIERRPPQPAKIVGIQQTVVGLVVVAATAVGVAVG